MNIKIIVLLFLFCLPSFAQSAGSYYNPKDDQFRLLGLKRAKELFESSKAEFERQKQLKEKGMISNREFDKAQSSFADAEVNYQQALLAVLFEKQYISVIEAVKYQGKDGQKRVRLKLANTSGGGAEFKKLINIDDDLFNSLQPDVINNVYVSILNSENAIISQPYEAKVEQIIYGKPINIDFALLQDLDAVTVNIIYGNGTQRAPKIFLQKDASENKVMLQSEQFSQEVDLGKSANYGLSLELFSGSENTYKLEVVNLPKEINGNFIDSQSQARLSQFKFNETSQTRRAALQLYLPDRPTDNVKIDEKITFYVLAIPVDKIGTIQISNREYSEQEIVELGVGYLKLELVPRGIGKIKVKAPQLFYSVLPGETVQTKIQIENEGTRRLDNIEFEIDLPLNWNKKAEPQIVESLGIRNEVNVEFYFYPPEDVAVGKYEIRIRTTSLSDNQLIKAEDKTISVEIKQEANIAGTLLIILLIVGLVTGIVIFGIKLARK